MARKPVNAPAGRGKGRGGVRGRGRGRRGNSREANSLTDAPFVTRRGRGNVSHCRSYASKKRGSWVTKRGAQRNEAASLTEEHSAGEKTARNMFGGEDDDAGGIGYMERGLTASDLNYLSNLSAPEIALLYGRHAGKAMASGYWAARRMLVERGVSRALVRENGRLNSELDRLKSEIRRGSVGSGPTTSKGKEVLIDPSEEKDADRLETDSPCLDMRWGKLPDCPPPPPPAEPLCRSLVDVPLVFVVLKIVSQPLSLNNLLTYLLYGSLPGFGKSLIPRAPGRLAWLD